MSRIADILATKGDQVHTIGSSATVREAIEAMVNANVGSLIISEGEQILGIFTERDYLRRIILEGRTSEGTAVSEVMTADLVCIAPDQPVEEAMSVMTRKRIRHLPVIHEGRLAGLVSIGDLVKYISREQEAEIRYLTDYISGKYPG